MLQPSTLMTVLACAGTFLAGSFAAPRSPARPIPQCFSCTLVTPGGNTFPLNNPCLGTLTETTSCSVTGPDCTTSGIVEWIPALAPNCLRPNKATDLQVFDQEVRGTKVYTNLPQNFDARISHHRLTGNAIPAGNHQTGSRALNANFKCAGGSYQIWVSGILTHFTINSQSACTCLSRTTCTRVDKKWTCQ